MSLGAFTMTVDWMHGTPDGCVRVVAMSHVTIYRIPHYFAQNLASEDELKQAGIYILVNTGAKTVYIGQADSRDNGHGLLNRMIERHSNTAIDDWDVGFALTSGTPHFFGATELNYLERLFYDVAIDTERYSVLNGNRPHATDVSFSTKTVLKNYVEFAFLLLARQANCDVFDIERKKGKKKAASDYIKTPAPKKEKRNNVPSPSDEPRIQKTSVDIVQPPTVAEKLFIERSLTGIHAIGEMVDQNKIRIKAGSSINPKTSSSFHSRGNINMIRLKLEESGVIKNHIFTEDYVFTSPSTAATIILGTPSSGNKEWKTEDGRMLGDLRGSFMSKKKP